MSARTFCTVVQNVQRSKGGSESDKARIAVEALELALVGIRRAAWQTTSFCRVISGRIGKLQLQRIRRGAGFVMGERKRPTEISMKEEKWCEYYLL